MRGDGEVACSLATTEGQEELAPIRGGPQKAENCEKGVEIHGKANLGAGSTEFAGADVKIAGDDATAQSGIGFCMRLKKVDGTWLVDAGPGPVLPGDPPECTP